jgi:hypothetical protein
MNQSNSNPLPKVNAELPRSALRAAPVDKHFLLSNVEIEIDGRAQGFRLRFGRAVRPDAYLVASALGAAG